MKRTVIGIAVGFALCWFSLNISITKPVSPQPAPAPAPPAEVKPAEPPAPGPIGSSECSDCGVEVIESAAAVQDTEPVREIVEAADFDVAQFVHRIDINGGVQYASCVATGPGANGEMTYFTARHIFADANSNLLPLKSVAVDGQQLRVNVTYHGNDCASVVTPDGKADCAAIATVAPSPGDRVLLYGILTGKVQHGVIVGEGLKQHVQIDAADDGVTQGDSGGGVFTEGGELIGVVSSFFGSKASGTADVRKVFIAQLPTVPRASYAAAAAEEKIGFPVTRHSKRWHWNDGTMDRWTSEEPKEGMRFEGNGGVFIYHDGRMLPSEVILEFGAAWCAPCKPAHNDIVPALEKLGWPVVEVDTDKQRKISEHWGIENIPAFVVIRDGKEVSRQYGPVMPTTESPEGYGSVLGTTLKLADLLSPRIGKPIVVAEGVSLLIPKGCEWQTHDQADGSTKFTFDGQLPTVTASKSVLRVQPEVTDIVVRMGASALEMQFMLKRFPDFTLTIALGSP